MDIAGYIKEFLLLQNNVRVPELGSFLITNQSAIIDEAKKTITPPSKAVLFDENGKTVDQPFLKFLSGKEGITEEDALKSLSEFTTEVKAKLQSDGFITFPGFGKFAYDNNRQIQFEPFFTEFLSAEIYGLDTLTGITPLKEPDSKIIDEKEKTKIKEPEPVPAPVPVPVEEEQTESDENNDKKNHFARILVFSLIPLILVCAWI
ncbi:MAG: hypothetical protein Q8910_19450, partial [Bacteroidota bacterium]|nr:hypothetical protein [Bacteroidota bacterium]